MKWSLIAASLAAVVLLANGQVTVPGKWRVGTIVPSRNELVLPAQDNAMLLLEENGSHGGYQFAHAVDVHATPGTHGEWFEVPQGRVWALMVRSPGATALSLNFDKFVLGEGTEMYVHNRDRTLGAYTTQNVKAHGYFAVQPINGDWAIVEVFVPLGAPTPVISIFKVSHGYKSLAYGDSGRCNINVVCPTADGWDGPIRAAGMLLSQFGSRYCSGSMINTVDGSGKQYFLTANHCMGSNVANDIVMFNYQSTVCEREVQTDGPTDQTVQGLRLLAAYGPSDFTLLEIEEEIPASYNVHLSGFNALNNASTIVVGIHHPSGDIKKFSRANKQVIPTYWNERPNNFHWEVPSWDEGTTEPGSSGSPLYDINQRIIGQLHGGAASCSRIDYDSYGAVWASWDQGTQKLQPYLDPANTGIRVVNGIDLNTARANSRRQH